MRRAMALGVIVGAATMVLGFPGAGIAGGGCHYDVTQQDATEQDEATVRMIDACFDATITRVDPGTPVTFVSEDAGLVHNVGANQWGHFDDMYEGDTFTARFAEEGVYPFACNYHPGMTGAIVVGDGMGAGSGASVLTVPSVPEPVVARTPARVTASSSAPWIAAAGLGGLVLGAAGSILALRRRGAA